mmetsp:Transcript_26885/g.53774  ORF Transcript_26885/g.53774 Transcript_26885/m.53774 type:complete len:762 (+) Transcript_26885:234-2519(+)
MSVKKTAAESADGVPTMILPPPVPPIDGDEDAQTIYRLENECYKLRMCMTKVRKATQEWFFLETKLKNATDELDAAKEDRDLMLGGGDISFGMEVDAATNIVVNTNSGAASMPLILSPTKTEAQLKQERTELDLQRIEGQLDDHPKFSPEWFKLKEELVELRIKLDEGDTKESVNNNNNKVTEEELNTPSKKKNKENESFNENLSDTEVQVELPPQFHFRPISPPPSPSPLPSSPSTSSSWSRIVQPSPGKPLTNNYYTFNTDDQGTIEQRTLLKSQHAVACEELDKSPQFSQEWFTAKVKAVLLEDKLEELENGSNSCGGGSYLSFTGWSENEDEVEAISCADELECAMVAEALKQGCCVSPSFVGDEDLHGVEGGLDIGSEGVGVDTMELGLVLSSEDHLEGNTPTTWLEPKFSPSLFNTADDLLTVEHQRVEDEPTQHHDEKPTSDVDHMFDEFTSMPTNQLEIQNHHAMIIQEQWIIHSKCRPFKRMKSRALSYQLSTKDVSQEEKGKGFNLVGFIKNILPKDKYSQWETFAAVLIQNRWRSYLKRKQFRATVSCITRVQTLARCKQQRLLFCKQRENAIIIQCMARKHKADALRRRLGNNEVASLLNESESVLEGLKSLKAVINLQRFWRGRLARLQQVNEVNHVLEQSSYMLAQLTMLISAVTIQRRWRLHRDQMRHNKMKSMSPKPRKSGNRKQKSPKKPPTLKELGIECLRLSTRLSQLRKFTPEWTLVNVELKLVTEEMEYLYAESLKNGKP